MPPRVNAANWPEDAPSRFEDHIISISAGNSNLNWALHTGIGSGFVPTLFWRTPPVLRDEQNSDDPCTVLARHLPRQVHSLIFGTESAQHHKDNATKVGNRRRIPALSVNIVSTNHEHENGIQFLFKDVPSRVKRLAPFHFFSESDGAYETIGVDRVATLYSCKHSYQNRHILCFDAGTAWTYTCLTDKGKILGGGIAPGVGARFQCLSDFCDALPIIDHSVYHKALKEKLANREPFPIFAKDTTTAMMTSAFSEIANQTRYLVKHFLELVKQSGSPSKEKPVIVVAGGDSAFLIKILKEDFSGIVRNEPGNPMPHEDFVVEEAKHLVHYGVGQLLCHNMAPESTNPDDQLRETLKGNRIAKRFAYPNSYDDSNIFRGSIMQIKHGAKLEDDLFFIRYDDGDSEHLEFADVYDALQLYLEVGEVENGEKLKVEQINKAINQMEDSHKQLKEDAPKRKEKVDAELAAQRAKDDARRQTQGVKRNKNGNKTNASGPQKKRAKTTKETAVADKKTMYMNKRIAKAFEGPSGQAEIYFGTVTKLASQNPLYWHIHYDDDDEEEFDEKDLGRALRLYQANRNDDPRYNGGNSNNDSSLVDGLAEAGAASEATDNKE